MQHTEAVAVLEELAGRVAIDAPPVTVEEARAACHAAADLMGLIGAAMERAQGDLAALLPYDYSDRLEGAGPRTSAMAAHDAAADIGEDDTWKEIRAMLEGAATVTELDLEEEWARSVRERNLPGSWQPGWVS